MKIDKLLIQMKIMNKNVYFCLMKVSDNLVTSSTLSYVIHVIKKKCM